MRTMRGRWMRAWRHSVCSQASISSSGACRQKNAIHRPAQRGIEMVHSYSALAGNYLLAAAKIKSIPAAITT